MIPTHIAIIAQVLLPSADRFVNAKPTKERIPHVDKINIVKVLSNAFTILIQNELFNNIPPLFPSLFSY